MLQLHEGHHDCLLQLLTEGSHGKGVSIWGHGPPGKESHQDVQQLVSAVQRSLPAMVAIKDAEQPKLRPAGQSSLMKWWSLNWGPAQLEDLSDLQTGPATVASGELAKASAILEQLSCSCSKTNMPKRGTQARFWAAAIPENPHVQASFLLSGLCKDSAVAARQTTTNRSTRSSLLISFFLTPQTQTAALIAGLRRSIRAIIGCENLLSCQEAGTYNSTCCDIWQEFVS